jgi:hypothetical protein
MWLQFLGWGYDIKYLRNNDERLDLSGMMQQKDEVSRTILSLHNNIQSQNHNHLIRVD